MKHREKYILALLTGLYFLCSVRYFPAQPQKTVFSTVLHILSVAPFIIGSLLIINSFFKKTTGESLPLVTVARIYLTAGIVIEFFLGIYHYLLINS